MELLTAVRSILFTMIVALFLATGHAQAQELINNGGFETGNLNGWISSGTISVSSSNALSGAYSAVLTPNSSLSQVARTVPGTYYRVSLSSSTNLSVAYVVAISDSGDNPIVSSTSFLLPNGATLMTFKAKSTNTSLTINAYSPGFLVPMPAQTVMLDNISMKPMHYAHPGHYSGKVISTVSYPEVKLQNSRSSEARGRIDAAGHFLFTSSVGDEWSGIIGDDNTVYLDEESTTIAKATFSGGILRFTSSSSVLSPLFNDTFNRSETLELTRVGP